MNNEEKILQLLTGMNDRFDRLEKRFDGLEKRFDDFEKSVNERFDAVDQRFEAIDRRFDAVDQRFETIDRRFDAVDQRFEAIDRRFDAVDQRFGAIEDRVGNIEMQLTETNQIVKAILHAQEYTNAKLEGLEITTAKAAAMQQIDDRCTTIENKLNVLNEDLFTQKAEIRQLKTVKAS